MEIYRKCTGRASRARHFARACASETYMDMSQEPLCVEIYRKMLDATPGPCILFEPAQSKCTWTCHKSHFVWKFTAKMPDANPGNHFMPACAVEMHMDTSQGPFCVEIYMKKSPDASATTSIEHRALTVTGRNPQCGHTV